MQAELVFENGQLARLSKETSEQVYKAIIANKFSNSSLITDGMTTYNMAKVVKIRWIQ